MPALEVAGLAVGTVALAALFTTCIELFDYFELGRNYVYDYELACTKIRLLRERLRTWGISLRVTKPGAEDSRLQASWLETRDVVGKSLEIIASTLQNSDMLMQRYGMRRDRSSRSSLTFWRRSCWAIHDKRKFDILIQDLSFMIENLEKVAERLLRKRAVPEHHVVWSTTYNKPGLESNLPRLSLGSSSQAKHISLSTEDRQIRENGTQHIIGSEQLNTNTSIGVQGAVGHSGDTYLVRCKQKNKGGAIGVQGVISPEALAYLHDRIDEDRDVRAEQ